jgi:hypothetical protein
MHYNLDATTSITILMYTMKIVYEHKISTHTIDKTLHHIFHIPTHFKCIRLKMLENHVYCVILDEVNVTRVWKLGLAPFKNTYDIMGVKKKP